MEQEDHWPAEKLIGPTNESHEEERSTAALAVLCDTSQGTENVMEISNYSTLRRLLRVTAWVKRFCFNIFQRIKNDTRKGELKVEEIVGSENEWVKAPHQKLKQGDNYHQLVKKFGLQKNQDGIVRNKRRLEYSKLHPDARDPIILPKEHPLTLLQVQECNTRVLHSGVRSTLAELRTRFWVPKGRQVVKEDGRWKESYSVRPQQQACQIFE